MFGGEQKPSDDKAAAQVSFPSNSLGQTVPQSQEGLTTEKLPSIKRLFEKAKEAAGDKKVKIADMRKMIDSFGVSEFEFDEFFKEFIRNRAEELSVEEFDRQLARIEKTLIELCLGKGEEVKEQSEYVASNLLNGEDAAGQNDLSYSDFV